jgi:putative glutamine amidotransferase
MSAEACRATLERVDALVLTGGEDVNPARYGQAPHPRLGTTSVERDDAELALVETARELRLPTLAICRGVQVLNVALGGTLIQDIPSQVDTDIDHDPDAPRTRRTHRVEIDTDSRLARAVGVTHMEVNSVHHQAIDRVAPTLRVTATAPDGVIEAVETALDDPWWCVGVQWHPEDTFESGELDRRLFAALAGAASAVVAAGR